MYIDANVFLFARFADDEKGAASRKLLQQLTKTKRGVTCALTFDEILWVLRRNKESAQAKPFLEAIYAIEHLDIVGVTRDIPLLALDIADKYGLKPRNAFHVAVMQTLHETIIASDDADFDRVPWIRRVKI
jgi:predicted nucleic acid-binding protein